MTSTTNNLFRLNKCLAGYCRRTADKLIAEGRVSVNSKPAVLGVKVQFGDVIHVDGNPVAWEKYIQNQFNPYTPNNYAKQNSGFVYLKMWKPAGITCTTSDKDPSNIVKYGKFPERFPDQRIFPVGRLDKNSTGLILLTSDPSFQFYLLGSHKKPHEAPSSPEQEQQGQTSEEKDEYGDVFNRLRKVYEVTLRDKPTPQMLQRWEKGIAITTRTTQGKVLSYPTLPCRIVPIKKPQDLEGFEDYFRAQEQDSLRSIPERRIVDIDNTTTETAPSSSSPSLSNPTGRYDRFIKAANNSYTYQFTLHEGRNRQIRRMIESVDHHILRLHRSAIGDISLAGLSRPGEWKKLTLNELDWLYKHFQQPKNVAP
jgi:pseudouridine synthase